MVNRWIGIATLGLMLSVNAALLVRDILPDWRAGEPPVSHALRLESGKTTDIQIGILDGEGRRIGYSWTRCGRTEDLVTVRHCTVLNALSLSGDVQLPKIRMDTNLNYLGETTLNELRIQVRGFGIPIELNGEFIPPDDFPCEWRVGTNEGRFVLPAEATRAIGDIVRPFDSLAGLYVGKSWRVKLLNPLAGIVPDWGARNMMADSMLIQVTGTSPVDFHGTTVEAFVLAANMQNLRAWVTADGRVIRQEVELPLFGKLALVDEPYDRNTRKQVLEDALGD